MHITILPAYSKLADSQDVPAEITAKLPAGWQLSAHQIATYQALMGRGAAKRRAARTGGTFPKGPPKLLKTSQQQISRLESPGYEGHSLSMLRRVAEVLGAEVRVIFEPAKSETRAQVAERPVAYRTTRSKVK